MEKENEKISFPDTKLLIRCRLEMEPDFVSGRKKKAVLWGKVSDKMKMVNPNVGASKEQLQRKFLNLLATYKRIKKRNRSTGRDAPTWEFLTDFNEIYGLRHSIEPPSHHLQSSSEIPSCNKFFPVIKSFTEIPSLFF